MSKKFGSFTKEVSVKTFMCSLVAIVFLVVTIPCEAGGNRRRSGHHHGKHHNHQYRWFGVIPRPQWAPHDGYSVTPQYNYDYMPPPPHAMIGTPMVMEVPQPEPEIILVPKQIEVLDTQYEPTQRILIPEQPIIQEEIPYISGQIRTFNLHDDSVPRIPIPGIPIPEPPIPHVIIQ